MKNKKWFGIMVLVCVLSVMTFGLPSNVFSAEKITWKMQCNGVPPEKIFGYYGSYGQAQEISRNVAKRTNGNFEIKTFPGGSLFKANETLDALKNGAIQMLQTHGVYNPGKVPEANFEYSLPYAFADSKQASKLYFNPEYIGLIRKGYMEATNNKVYLLGLTGMSSMTYMTTFPINRLEDMKGKTLVNSGITAQVAKRQGANVVNIAQAERYMALQRGTASGCIYPAYGGITYKFFEVCKYQSWPPMVAVGTVNFSVNKDAFDKLPKEYQGILQDEVNKMTRYTMDVMNPALEKIGREDGAKQFGVKNIDLAPAEYERFKENARPVWVEAGSKNENCMKLLKIIEQTSEK